MSKMRNSQVPKVMNVSDLGLEDLSPKSLCSVPSIQDRNKLKDICLNLVLNIYFTDCNIEFDKNRDNAIKMSQKLFNELEEANYYGW